MSHVDAQGHDKDHDKGDAAPPLHIFVNRRKFGEGDGVRPQMTGAEIAALVDVPAGNAIVRIDSGDDKRQVGIDERITVEMGEHFLVTRKVVEGGHDRPHSA